jgi:hypothetical protein
MDSAHMAIALGHSHWSQQHQANAVIQPVTGKEMEYSVMIFIEQDLIPKKDRGAYNHV